MDRYRLKNIIIIILLLVNGFLAGSLAIRQTSERVSRRQTEEQLVELLAADGITLEADSIPAGAPPAGLSLPRDMEQQMVGDADRAAPLTRRDAAAICRKIEF